MADGLGQDLLQGALLDPLPDAIVNGPQPAVYPNTTAVIYVAALKKADVDALLTRLEREIDQLQDRLDQFNHGHRVEVDGRLLELAS